MGSLRKIGYDDSVIMQQNNSIPSLPDIPPDDPTNPVTDKKANPKAKRKFNGALATIGLIVLAVGTAILLTAFVFQSYEVDGQSMETTLQNNDRLIVLKIERTWARITGHDYVPNRGDVVIFIKRGLLDFGVRKDKQLIKRVIALPGERVAIIDGHINVYNAAYPDGFDPDKTLGYGANIPLTPGNNAEYTVPEGMIFVCGDNRPSSLDSRNFGPVPVKDIVGKLGMRIFPLSKAKIF